MGKANLREVTEEEQKQFIKECQELINSHDCDKCHGKIVAISVDAFGNKYCGYCDKKYGK